MDKKEEAELRSVALQNAQSIMHAREKAERDLLEAKETLERKTTELDRSVAMMEATFEATTDALLVTDADTRIRRFNRKFVEMWNLSPDAGFEFHQELVDHFAPNLRHRDDFWARIEEIYRTHPDESFDVLELEDGRTIERYSRRQVVKAGLEGRVWSLRDVTDQRKSAEALSRLATIVETSDDAIVSKTLDGTISTWNASAEQIFGYPAKEVVGKNISIIIPPEHSDEETRILDRIRRGERIGHYQTERLRKDRTLVPISLTVSPIKDKDGRIVGASKIARDISAQKSAERENQRLLETIRSELAERSRIQSLLEESETQLRATFNQAAVGIAIANLEGRFVQVNDRFASILGYTADELLKIGFRDFTHPDDLEMTNKNVARLLAGEADDYAYEKRYIRKDGREIWSHTTVTLLRDSEKRPLRYVGVIEDISARKAAEQERLALLESERSARVEAERLGRLKDEFLATLSHELRTPLSAILGWTFLIKSNVADLEKVTQGIETIERNARLQTQLVADLLDMSRIISGKMRLDVQAVQLPVIIIAALDSVRPAADAKGVRVETILDPIADPVYGDPGRLQQILWNLASNAVKFTPRGGKVQVVLRRVNSHVEVSVADTGQGISPEFLPHLFERFRQEDASAARKHGGLGIGLALVKHLTDLHGGRIEVESGGLGTGATFRLNLPLAAVHPAPEVREKEHHPRAVALAAPSMDPADLGGVRVLAVDDEPDARELIRRLLEDCGAEIFLASSADEALAILERERADVLISDIGMPDIDGYQFIRSVRGAGHTMPAVALTAFARSEDRTRAFKAGYQAHVAKPVEPAELLATVASLVGRIG